MIRQYVGFDLIILPSIVRSDDNLKIPLEKGIMREEFLNSECFSSNFSLIEALLLDL